MIRISSHKSKNVISARRAGDAIRPLTRRCLCLFRTCIYPRYPQSSQGDHQAGVNYLLHEPLRSRRDLLRPPPLRCLWLDGSIIISWEGHRTLKSPSSFWIHGVIARPNGVMAHRSCMLTVLPISQKKYLIDCIFIFQGASKGVYDYSAISEHAL